MALRTMGVVRDERDVSHCRIAKLPTLMLGFNVGSLSDPAEFLPHYAVFSMHGTDVRYEMVNGMIRKLVPLPPWADVPSGGTFRRQPLVGHRDRHAWFG